MKRKHLSLAIGCVLLSSTPLAWAQDAAPADASPATNATTLDSVKVTARKREETLQDVPVAVTAFTAETLDKLAIKDIGDLDAQVPNLTIYAARGSTSTVTAYIRGVGQADPLWGVDPGVGIYLDDVYIARPQGALLDVFDVERIEVLRGPQGTLYGKNTIGGAIKYISRGLPQETTGFASVTVGNYNQLDVKAALGGEIGGKDSGLRGRVSVASMNRDGFGTNTYTGQGVSDKEINAVRMQLGAYSHDDFDVQVAFDYMDDQSGVRGAKMLARNPLAPAYPPTNDRYDIRSGMKNINDTEMKGASITANWRPSEDWAIKYVAAKRESDTETNIDFDTIPSPLVDVRAFYSDSQVSQEFQVNYDGGGRARGVMGLYWFNGDAGGQVLNYFWNPALATSLTNPLFGDTQGVVNTKSIALYADWTFDLTDRLTLDVGARYTDEDKHAVALNRFYTSNQYETSWGAAANFDKTVNFKNVSPKVSLDYQVTPDIMVYGLASRGFKSGGYNIRANTTAVPRSGEPFNDEQVDSFEVGSKMSFLDQRLFLNLSAFHNIYKDIQLSVFTSYTLPNNTQSFFGDFTNAGKGTVNGVEVEYQFLPTANWLISGNLAWLDAKYDEFISSGVNIASTQYFTNAPEFSGALNVEYRTDLANGGNLSARVGYSYQSEVWPTTDLSPLIKQEGYGLVNAGVIWKVNDAWSLSLQGTNLADQEYRTTGYNIAAYGVLTGFYGPPRQYSLTARYDF
ncbi:iron complex outermembrane receptor protein [Pseudoxanthomonas japonensis]|uniref:TonB-dependent receptor n=1 Tax=Pseudoxanthomonas TaxID=83618 RepID=UPI000783BF2B|nr:MULTISPECIES: TonB-dependent receptor [Pseudoxanthomonas]MBA3930029.1 TonB-dependent receptor [Xanthomonas sp.]MBL8257176.1 TonB-dependent receptor [Pseudoxanthomonas mexicana]MDR7069005.1 iron complex outermembrane receptor protein [Pseudoxanthomonas japonensis]